MSVLQDIGRSALRGALDVRQKIQVTRSAAICVYDVAEKLGVEVRFIGGSSFEGMYSKSNQTILVPSLRPPGRQAYACGHELGHWYFDHGSTFDNINTFEMGRRLSQEDQLANTFASYLIAPPWAVHEAFKRRQCEISTCTPIQLYSVANQLGMGYETLIKHLWYSLHFIHRNHAEELLLMSPKKIREQLLGKPIEGHLIISGLAWTDVPVDLQVGDSVIIPEHTIIEGDAVLVEGNIPTGIHLRGQRPGIARAYHPDSSWATYLRVSRKAFEGRSIYRHLEDPDVN